MSHTLRTILLIDDNEADNFLHELVIEEIGIADQVVSYTNAEEALEYLKSLEEGSYPQPDLIFLDINMPGMNGWEFLEEYRRLPTTQQGGMVVVMLTTSLNPSDRERAEANKHVKHFQSKPLTEESLREIVQTSFRMAA